MSKTKIEWTDAVFNPVTGCTPISSGCLNCYARRMARRLAGQHGYPEAPHEFDITLHPDRLEQPLRWQKPRMVFVGSMSDIFHADVPFEFIDKIFAVIALCPQHVFQILSKRPERMKTYLSATDRVYAIQRAIDCVSVDIAAGKAEEEWRPVIGYEGFYEVSSFGQVRRSDKSKKGRRNIEGVLQLRITRGGYKIVALSKNGHVQEKRVNRLVLMAFKGPPSSLGMESRHCNGVRDDNRAVNLCWGTRQENMIDASRHGMAGAWAKKGAKFNPEQIKSIRDARESGIKLRMIAKKFNTSFRHISAICVGTKYVMNTNILWPLPNVWAGCSVEDQVTADKRIPLLLQTPATTRFVSAEPCLAAINLSQYLPELDWCICGGESGPKARPMQSDWARSLRDQCRIAETLFFFKQWGGVNKKETGRVLDGQVWDEMPKLLL